MTVNDTFIQTAFALSIAVMALLLLFLLLRVKRQQQLINQLFREIKNQQAAQQAVLERVRKSVQPDFVTAGIVINESVNRIDIKVQNKGAAATIEKVVTSTPDIEFIDDRDFPLRLEHKDFFVVTGISKGLPLAQCRYVVQLHYSDAYSTQYLTAIKGEGEEFKITTTVKS